MGGPASRSIRDELLLVPGVAEAEFDGDPAGPAGVKVQLAPGADADDVGRQVRRVLAGHGMRSQLTAPAVAPRRPPPPPEPRTVINLAEFDQGGLPAPPPDTEAAEPIEVAAEPEPASAAEDATPVAADPTAQVAPEAGDAAEAAVSDEWVPVLGEVVLAQRAGRVTVSVAGGDRVARQEAVAARESIDRALLAAVCELLGVAPAPELVSVEETEQAGSALISVLVDDGSARRSGSAVDRGSRAWAVARAFWSAVSGSA